MNNTSKISDIRKEMTVKIIKQDNLNSHSIGKIAEVISKTDDLNGILVLLENGDSGHIVEIINSVEIIRERILSTESHNSENKLNFYEPIMKEKVIPLTIQSFLNSNGGYVYVGIYDDGKTPSETFVGLKEDKKFLEDELIILEELKSEEKLSDMKFKDIYRSDIEKTLDRFLVSDENLGSLIDFNFPVIDGVMILEINITRSDSPVFYKHKSRNNKEINFEIYENGKKLGDRKIDEFYYRDGSRKVRIDTFEEFYTFLQNNFQQI